MTGMRWLSRWVWVALLLSAVAACQASDDLEPGPAPAEGEISMGGSALGGNAQTTVLGRAVLANENIVQDPAWIAHEVHLAEDETVEHSHEFAFLYAKEGPHRLTLDADRQVLEPGSGAEVAASTMHRHEGAEGASVFWEIRLAPPGSALPGELDNVRPIFESQVGGKIPPRPLAVFVYVLVPSGGQTSVHTHPGPELIYTISGTIEYENKLIGTKVMGPGEFEGIPPGVPVQKRNTFEQDAEFLSWFLVDGAQPFASPARFPAPGIEGENLALLENGASVVGVSSNYQDRPKDSAFGANNALDGDPTTEWSSNGDGDEAWIEIELPEVTQVRTIGFWTRTMGDSAQVFSFRVVTDRDEIYGPFELGDAASVYYFDTDFTAQRLRFEAVDTSGGNTGAIEIEVYGEPAG